jgi:glycerol kinase
MKLNSMPYLLAIDQGTTNSKAIIFQANGQIVKQHEMPLTHAYPHPGWVEQNPEEMFYHTLICCREVLKKSHLSINEIAAAGITNQRETTILWDRKTGKPIYPAIVWLDRRTSDICHDLQKQIEIDKNKNKNKNFLQNKTGLILDPYFSATKIKWILHHVPHAQEKAKSGELAFGTVDSFLLWQLTKGQSHLTDITNASRTLLFNIHTQSWDEELLNLFDIPKEILPEVRDNASHFGEIDASFLGKSLPITGMAGDQQAAAIGQACFQPGMVKTTYGTGCFMLLNTGQTIVHSHHQLLSTVAYRINQEITYGLEGSIFCAGTTIKWLRDELKLINHVNETESLAQSVHDNGGVYFVPAFTGLGAPYWNPHARAAILGLSYNSNTAHIARAALESVVYQTKDLLEAMIKDYHHQPIDILRVDGGMAVNNWFLQFLANILNIEIQRPACIETTALGAAYLAGLQIGLYNSLDDIADGWAVNQNFKNNSPREEANNLYTTWLSMVKRVL